MQSFLQPQISSRVYCMSWSWNPFANQKVMMQKVFLYRSSRELFFVCDMENKWLFCSKLVSYNAVKFFKLSFFVMRYPEKIITTTSEVCFKANSHNTVWNVTHNLCVTSLNLFRISPWQGKRSKIHFKYNTFCVVKSPMRKRKYNSL